MVKNQQHDFKNWYQSLDYKDFPVLMDSKGELLKEYGIRSYPSALFIGSDGTLAKTHIGYMSKEDIVKTLKEMQVERSINMETKWKIISVLFVGLLCLGLFFLSLRDRMDMDTSDTIALSRLKKHQ